MIHFGPLCFGNGATRAEPMAAELKPGCWLMWRYIRNSVVVVAAFAGSGARSRAAQDTTAQDQDLYRWATPLASPGEESSLGSGRRGCCVPASAAAAAAAAEVAAAAAAAPGCATQLRATFQRNVVAIPNRRQTRACAAHGRIARNKSSGTG
ncbi:GD12447 [Drosophila simulans]|uniref:GD12447 n=1 Tax=Drosophila simulans TaxID=7240 RepID=B4QMX3_DROSI|nr:GD12447 [Drosophila simulans]